MAGECLMLVPHFGTTDIIPALTSLVIAGSWMVINYLLLHNEVPHTWWLNTHLVCHRCFG